MSEREAVPPQQPAETASEEEKAAEEEHLAAQEIMENLYDVFGEDYWLIHYTPSLRHLESILKRGILSRIYSDTARELGDKTMPSIDKDIQGIHYISAWGKYFFNLARFGWKAMNPIDETGIIFTLLKNETPEPGPLVYDKKVKFKVAKSRFKALVTLSLKHPQARTPYAQQQRQSLQTFAQVAHLPVMDNSFNLLYPISIHAEALREITIPRLRELAKTLGIEKLRAMSVEEIKSAAGALTEK